MKKKFVVQFIVQYVLILILFLLSITLLIVYLSQKLTDQEYQNDFSRANKEYFSNNITLQDPDVIINENIKEAVIKQNGWLQVINSQNGNVIKSLNAPTDVPNIYTLSDLNAIIHDEYLSRYSYLTWELNSNTFVLYGKHSKSNEILHYLVENKKILDEPNNLTKYLRKRDAWVVLYNKNASTYKSFNIDKSINFLTNNLIDKQLNAHDSKYDIKTQTLQNNNLVIVGTINPSYENNKYIDNKLGLSVVMNTIICLCFIVLVLVIVSIFYAKTWGRHIIHIIKWIENLASQKFYEPNKSYTFFKRNSIRKNKLFNDITSSLEKLTYQLESNKEYRKKLEVMREEWITGLSHDLKTPLSSILGYSILIKSNTYEWSNEELQHIGETIASKAGYIDSLIEDLNMTFQLKNHALPLSKEETNIESLLQKLIVEYINNHQDNNYNVVFINKSLYKVIYPIDSKLFKRVLENLLANAIKYNPKNTKIEVILGTDETGFYISVKDNGVGMDKNTQENLFNRYYRGTSTTEDQNGSGLGMAITKQLVEAHGGQIEVKSNVGEGTKIHLYFPKKILIM